MLTERLLVFILSEIACVYFIREIACVYQDLDGDGMPELISGWSNGKIEVRNDHNGEVVYKDYFNDSISGIVEADYRMDGRVRFFYLLHT